MQWFLLNFSPYSKDSNTHRRNSCVRQLAGLSRSTSRGTCSTNCAAQVGPLLPWKCYCWGLRSAGHHCRVPPPPAPPWRRGIIAPHLLFRGSQVSDTVIITHPSFSCPPAQRRLPMSRTAFSLSFWVQAWLCTGACTPRSRPQRGTARGRRMPRSGTAGTRKRYG
jgi:hypothetical protein